MEDGARATFRTIAVLTLIPVAALGLLYLWSSFSSSTSPAERREAQPRQVTATAPSPQLESALPRVHPRRRHGSGEIVLIIDDLGFEGQPLDGVMALDPNVN